MSRAASPPASASSLRSSRAALENASRFLSSAPCRVRISCTGPKNERLPLLGALSNKWWAMRDVRVRLHRPLPLRRFAPCVLRWKTLARFLSSAPCRVRIPLRWAQAKTVPFRGPLSNKWWAMRDVACGFAALFRFVASLLACFAGKRFAFPQLRTLTGSNPSATGPKRKAPIAGGLTIQVVGDEGFEPPALCV